MKDQATKFVIERTYPDSYTEGNPFDGINIKTNKRFVNLEIQTLKELPDEFFTELSELVEKHQK